MEVTIAVSNAVGQCLYFWQSHYQEEVQIQKYTFHVDHTTWSNDCKDTSNSIMKSCHSFGLSALYKEVSTVIVT